MPSMPPHVNPSTSGESSVPPSSSADSNVSLIPNISNHANHTSPTRSPFDILIDVALSQQPNTPSVADSSQSPSKRPVQHCPESHINPNFPCNARDFNSQFHVSQHQSCFSNFSSVPMSSEDYLNAQVSLLSGPLAGPHTASCSPNATPSPVALPSMPSATGMLMEQGVDDIHQYAQSSVHQVTRKTLAQTWSPVTSMRSDSPVISMGEHPFASRGVDFKNYGYICALPSFSELDERTRTASVELVVKRRGSIPLDFVPPIGLYKNSLGASAGIEKRLKPSRFCHICARTSKKVGLLSCVNFRTGSCRKVICQKCFGE